MNKCYNDLDQPVVTFDTFWEVYCDLRDRVEVVAPEDLVMGLSQSIFSEPAAADPFALAHLNAPEIDMRNVDVEGEEGHNGDIFSCEFTVDNDRDQLY